MPIPVWVLLGFATWTLLILFATVGVYRWSRILTGRTAIAAWRADEMQGTEWYRRAIRAHMNCVENLPIYTAIVVALLAARVTSPLLDGLAIVILLARICQSSFTCSWNRQIPSRAFVSRFILSKRFAWLPWWGFLSLVLGERAAVRSSDALITRQPSEHVVCYFGRRRAGTGGPKRPPAQTALTTMRWVRDGQLVKGQFVSCGLR